MSKDCCHLEEAIGKGIWFISLYIQQREAMKHGVFKIETTSCFDFPQGFACNISSVILTGNILTVLETSESFSIQY